MSQAAIVICLLTACYQDVAEKAGTLSWDELAHVHFKIKVAKKHELAMHQPGGKKKVSRPSMASGAEPRDATVAVASEVSEEPQKRVDVVVESASGAEDLSWMNQPCPLRAASSRNMITEDDVVATISQLTCTRSAVLGVGGSGNKDREAVGRSVQRWKMGLDLQQFIN